MIYFLFSCIFLFTANFCLKADTISLPSHTVRLADGFDFPVAPPNAEGFYTSRGVSLKKHLGEDWLKTSGSSYSLGAPVYAVADGEVLLARDVHVDWGNVVVIRHAYWEKNKVNYIDSLYAHLDTISVKEGSFLRKGHQIGTIGNNHGMYPPHLHFELHKNLNIGVNHTGFARSFRNYWIPKLFIKAHRILSTRHPKPYLPPTHFALPATFGRGFQHRHHHDAKSLQHHPSKR